MEAQEREAEGKSRKNPNKRDIVQSKKYLKANPKIYMPDKKAEKKNIIFFF